MNGLYDAVVERLADAQRCPAILQAVTGMSTDAADALTVSEITSAVVVPLADSASPVREASLRVTQREQVRFGVVMALAYPAGFATFEPARDQIKAALRGWTPDGAATPVEYSGGRLVSYEPTDGGKWLHILEFVCSTLSTYEAQT